VQAEVLLLLPLSAGPHSENALWAHIGIRIYDVDYEKRMEPVAFSFVLDKKTALETPLTLIIPINLYSLLCKHGVFPP